MTQKISRIVSERVSIDTTQCCKLGRRIILTVQKLWIKSKLTCRLALNLFCIVARWALGDTYAIAEYTYHIRKVPRVYLGNHICAGTLRPVKVRIVFCCVGIATSV
jgi:hypothetical protein